MAPALLMQDNAGGINSLDFHRKDDLMITADTDDAIRLYNTSTGTQQKMVHSKKYGAAHITFTHHANSVLHASTKVCPTFAQPFSHGAVHQSAKHRATPALCMHPMPLYDCQTKHDRLAQDPQLHRQPVHHLT